MKTTKFLAVFVIIFLLGVTFQLNAQQGDKQGPKMDKKQGFSFTPEQEAKMKEIHMASYKEIKVLKNQLAELKAKEHTLTTADKSDLNAINSNIDEMTKVQNKMMKIKAYDLQQIRNLLTDEQKMWFDSKEMKMRHEMKMHQGMKNGHQFRKGGDFKGSDRTENPENS
jgi:Spy/CpxP family protein refolding chaperone